VLSIPVSCRHSATLRPSKLHIIGIGGPNGSVHSATLGKGKADDTIKKVKNGDLKGKGEVVMVFGKQASSLMLIGIGSLQPGYTCGQGGTDIDPRRHG
jgi:hypothetical protein